MQTLFEELSEMSMAAASSLEDRLDKLFAPLGVDIKFSSHFKDRLAGREDKVEPEEVYDAFSKFGKKFGGRIYMSKKMAGILQDMKSNLNIPFSIQVARKGKEMVTITVMRKKDFKQFSGDERFIV